MNATYYKNDSMYVFCLDSFESKRIRVIKTTAGNESVFYIPCRVKSGYAVSVNKKSVSADGGARGVFSFIADCIKNDFMLVFVDKIIATFER